MRKEEKEGNIYCCWSKGKGKKKTTKQVTVDMTFDLYCIICINIYIHSCVHIYFVYFLYTVYILRNYYNAIYYYISILTLPVCYIQSTWQIYFSLEVKSISPVPVNSCTSLSSYSFVCVFMCARTRISFYINMYLWLYHVFLAPGYSTFTHFK